MVSLIDEQGVRRLATTSSFGIYTFELVSAREITLRRSAQNDRFAPRFVLVQGALTNLDFTGLE